MHSTEKFICYLFKHYEKLMVWIFSILFLANIVYILLFFKPSN